ncbi:MAG: tRNA nucleotidyltransferase [Desulfohalobiaceae bacterium]
MQIYQFGGAVRDKLLGLKPKDLDYLVLNCSEQEFLQAHPGAKKIGHRPYQVYLYQNAQYTLSDSQDIYSELQKKDLTINSLAQDSRGNLVCSELALQDLKQKKLRPIQSKNFLQDPVRVFRAARLSAKLPDFQIHPELLKAMQEVSDLRLLDGAVAERLGQELQLTCSTPRPGNFLRLLADTANLQPWLPELDNAQNIPAGPDLNKLSLLQHVAGLMDAAAGKPQLVWLAMCFDLGKIKTDPAYWPRHLLHDFFGPKVINSLGTRLRLPLKQIQIAKFAAAWHLAACGYYRLRPGPKVDMLLGLHNKAFINDFTDLLKLIQAPELQEVANRDLQRILEVRLPKAYRNLGPESGKILKRLRVKALQES